MQGSLSFTRERLYEMVWRVPVSRIAPRLGLSDRGLAKLCSRHRIPLPGRGYWQRLKAGRRVTRKKLPRLRIGEEELASVQLWVSRKAAREQGVVEERREFEEHIDNKITVPETITRYHPLVRQTRKALRSGGSEASRLDVEVDSKSISRALRIMDTLIKALERRGFSVQVGEHGTRVLIDGTSIAIRLDERFRQVEIPPSKGSRWSYPRRRREATGELALRILSWRAGRLRCTWADGKRQRVEACLNRFIVGLVAAAERKRVVLLEEEEAKRRREVERRLAAERVRREQEEQARIDELTRQVEAWRANREARHYLGALREAAGSVEPGSELAEWLKWVESHVERSDPLARLGELTMPKVEEEASPRPWHLGGPLGWR